MHKKILGYGCLFLMVFISLALIFSKQLRDSAIQDKSRQLSINNFTIDDIQSNKSNAKEFVEEDVEIPGILDVMQGISQVDRDDVIGGILIPEVGINLPIFPGVTRNDLMAGAGSLNENQVPGQGNYALAGHHMKDPSLLFGPLMDVKEGDYIYITDQETLWVYKVTMTDTIHETNVKVIEETEDPVITLITCNISGINTNYRWVVQGELVESGETDQIDKWKTIEDYVRFIEINRQGHNMLLWFLLIAVISAFITLGCRYIINK